MRRRNEWNLEPQDPVLQNLRSALRHRDRERIRLERFVRLKQREDGPLDVEEAYVPPPSTLMAESDERVDDEDDYDADLDEVSDYDLSRGRATREEVQEYEDEMRRAANPDDEEQAENMLAELRQLEPFEIFGKYEGHRWLNMYEIKGPRRFNTEYENHWYRHRCGDFMAPWEEEFPMLFTRRKQRERDHLYRLSIRSLMPETQKLIEILADDSIPLGTDFGPKGRSKRHAVRCWEAAHLEACQPDLLEHPCMTIVYGSLYHELPSAIALKSSPTWRQYQADIEREKDDRHAATKVAKTWLRRHEEELLARKPKPELLLEAESRLRVLNWTLKQARKWLRGT